MTTLTNSFELVTAPATEPITLSLAKEHLNVDLDTHDTLITRAIKTAREHTEKYLRSQIITATWKMHLDRFPWAAIEINKPPISSITHVKYFDADNNQQTWDSSLYETDLILSPSRLQPISTETYPSTFERLKAVEIQFVTGYADADAVPEPIQDAMYLIIGHLYANRQDVITGTQVRKLLKGSEWLLDPYRSFVFV